MLKKLFLAVVSFLLLASAQAKATTLVYDNGTENGTINGWNIGAFQVSDSFTLTSMTTLTEAQIGLDDAAGSPPVSVDWSIGTTAFASDVSSGTGATLTNTPDGTGSSGVPAIPLYESTFAITGTLGPGTYWFTLQNSSPIALYWDETNGPSSAFQTSMGAIGSESFELYSASTASAAVPEISASGAGSLAILLLGAVALLGQGRRAKSLV